MYYLISGYWKDDCVEFEDYVVRQYDDSPPDGDIYTDDDIFYYGLSENDIKTAIDNPFDTALDFVITSYEPVLPDDVMLALSTFDDNVDPYHECQRLLADLQPLGYTFDFGLDGVPFNFKPITNN